MKILIFSGTSDGRQLSEILVKDGHEVCVSVATDYGQEEQKTVPGVAVITGRLKQDEMEAVLPGYDLCVDATHPYALEVTQNIRAACDATDVLCKRLIRPEEVPAEGAGSMEFVGSMKFVGSATEAVATLRNMPGRILLTTGAKDLQIYGALGGERLYPRVLPTAASLEACEAAGIPRRNIIAMHGPFTERLNQALMDQYRIDLMVTKDSGKAGGFMDKVHAAAEEGVFAVVIARPEDSGDTMEEIIDWCREHR